MAAYAANILHMNATGTSPNAAQIVWGDNTGWKLHFGTTSATDTFLERMTLVDTGAVGIGTTSPGALLTLDVSGRIRSGSYFRSDWNNNVNDVGWYWNSYWDPGADNRYECVSASAWTGTASTLNGSGGLLRYLQGSCTVDGGPVNFAERLRID